VGQIGIQFPSGRAIVEIFLCGRGPLLRRPLQQTLEVPRKESDVHLELLKDLFFVIRFLALRFQLQFQLRNAIFQSLVSQFGNPQFRFLLFNLRLILRNHLCAEIKIAPEFVRSRILGREADNLRFQLFENDVEAV
jgi:hypothetical protein